jgi:hypothetical protein
VTTKPRAFQHYLSGEAPSLVLGDGFRRPQKRQPVSDVCV